MMMEPTSIIPLEIDDFFLPILSQQTSLGLYGVSVDLNSTWIIVKFYLWAPLDIWMLTILNSNWSWWMHYKA